MSTVIFSFRLQIETLVSKEEKKNPNLKQIYRHIINTHTLTRPKHGRVSIIRSQS